MVEMYSIWTERYRPENFNEVVGQEQIVKTIESFVKSREIPHLLFAGPAGSGKSTVALIIGKKLYGENWRSNFLEMNASDERGINVVRSKIKDFAKVDRPFDPGPTRFKIIFLDEADALTPDAQNALRRLMETYSETCRFILSCNYSSRIIEPIQSRCALFRFKAISLDDMKKRLEFIAKNEKVKIDDEALNVIYELSNGDMRKAINIIQTAAINAKNVNKKVIYDVIAQAEPKDVKKMVNLALKGDFLESRKLLLDLLLRQGISGEDIIKQILDQIYNLDISEKSKVELIEKIGEFEFRMNQGGNEQIQLEALLAKFANLKK